MGTNQQFSLRWNNYLRHITCAFDTLRSDEDLVDVTLSCEGKRIRAHKMLLSACSTYFRDLFKENPCQHPVIIFRNVKFEDLSALIDFMYQGEVNVVQDQLASFLTTAELLAVQGLSDGNAKENEDDSVKEVELPDSPVMPTEPEVQMSNNHEPKAHHSSTPSYNAAPPSSPKFYPTDQRPGTPPPKRRKWASSAGGSSKGSGGTTTQAPAPEKERERDLRRVSAPPLPPPPRRESPEPVEIIPVVPHLKLEMPDYIEEQDASSCSYGGGDSSQGGGSRGDPLPLMAQLLGHSDTENKDTLDLYSSNSREASLPVPESLAASDPNLMLGKPGPSGESSSQGQDSLQGGDSSGLTPPTWNAADVGWTLDNPTVQRTTRGWLLDGSVLSDSEAHKCGVCGKAFRCRYSLTQHMPLHTGATTCQLCRTVFSRVSNYRRHLSIVHGISTQ